MVVFLPLLTWYLLQNIQRFFFVWIFWLWSPHDDQLLLMHLILPKISTESDFLWWKEHKGSPKRVGKKIWLGTFNCIYNSWINIYLSRCKFLFNDIFVLRKIQGLETVKIWLLRSRDNSKQDGKSLCCKLVIHLFENTTPYCHVDLNLHLDLDPCVPLSLPINKLEMSLCVRKEFPFSVLLQAAKHTKNSKCTHNVVFSWWKLTQKVSC